MEYGRFCIVFVKENYQGYNTYFSLNPFALYFSIFLPFHTIKEVQIKKRRQNNDNKHEE